MMVLTNANNPPKPMVQAMHQPVVHTQLEPNACKRVSSSQFLRPILQIIHDRA